MIDSLSDKLVGIVNRSPQGMPRFEFRLFDGTEDGDTASWKMCGHMLEDAVFETVDTLIEAVRIANVALHANDEQADGHGEPRA